MFRYNDIYHLLNTYYALSTKFYIPSSSLNEHVRGSIQQAGNPRIVISICNPSYLGDRKRGTLSSRPVEQLSEAPSQNTED